MTDFTGIISIAHRAPVDIVVDTDFHEMFNECCDGLIASVQDFTVLLDFNDSLPDVIHLICQCCALDLGNASHVLDFLPVKKDFLGLSKTDGSLVLFLDVSSQVITVCHAHLEVGLIILICCDCIYPHCTIVEFKVVFRVKFEVCSFDCFECIRGGSISEGERRENSSTKIITVQALNLVVNEFLALS